MDVKKIETNFFYSANSEHYQDAFLKWIFFNFPSGKDNNLSEIEKFSRYFVERLLNYNGYGLKIDSIIEIVVENQVDRSDVDFIIKTTKNGDHLILIEDKTNTSVHSSNNRNDKEKIYDTQLEKYYDSFLLNSKKYETMFNEGKVHLFYYKNSYLGEEESDSIDRANSACKELFKTHINEYSKEKQRKIENGRNSKKSIALLNEKIKTASAHLDDNSVYTWNILDIGKIEKIFSEFANTFGDPILKQYFDFLRYKKRWLDVDSYPLYVKDYDSLSDNFKKMAWFSYLRNYLKKELSAYIVDEKGGIINEPYWHQGGNDINIAIYADKNDLPQIRIMTNKINDPSSIVIQVAIYGAEKKDSNGKVDNSYYDRNKKQIALLKEEIQKKYEMDHDMYLLRKDDTPPTRGIEKTIATTNKINLCGVDDIDTSLIKIIKKCFNQLMEIPEDIRLKKK